MAALQIHIRARPFWIVAALAALTTFSEAAYAQIEPSPTPVKFCWRGRPAPACTTFLLAEGNAYLALAGSRYTRAGTRGGPVTRNLELARYVAWEVGGMLNVDTNDAVGGSVLLGVDANGARWALKGRYRRWLDAGTAVDVGAGVLGAARAVQRESGFIDQVPAVGLTGDLSVGATEWASIGVRADVLFSPEHDEPATAYYLGTRLGTRPALAATAVPVVAAAVTLLVILVVSPSP